MKIKRLKIEHFRSWKSETITVDNYNCFVGANGAGKSAVLCALNTFFRHTQNTPTNVLSLDEEDFYRKDTTQPIRITLTFDDLNAEAQQDLKAYYRQGELTVHIEAVWDDTIKAAVGQHYGSRRIMKAFSPYFAADEEKKSASDLKEIYKGLRDQNSNLPNVSTKDAMRDGLRAYEEQHPDECELAASENQFYGWSKGANHLQKYVQWVYVPAAKDVSSEQDEKKNSAFGQLLERTIRHQVDFAPHLVELKKKTGEEYQKVLATGKESLGLVSERLQTRLRTWSSPRSELRLDWLFDEQSVTLAPPVVHAKAGEDSFLGEIARLGHGLQRSYLVALLQELAENKGEASQPTLILGFEEPELYQHPPQAKYLRTVLEELSANGAQVLITTHSPHMVSSQGFINVRRVTKERGTEPASKAKQATYDEVAELMSKCLGGGKPPSRSKALADIEQIMEPSLSELYFCDVAILVEGSEDVAHFSAHLALTDQLGWFREFGCHFVVCRGKTNISRPLAIAHCLGIPAFTVFDSDFDDAKEEKANRRDNSCLLALAGNAGQDPMATTSFVGANVVMFSPDIAAATKTEFGKEEWDKLNLKVREKFELTSDVKGKNAFLIAHLLEEAYQQRGPSKCLEAAVAAIKAFAESVYRAPTPTAPLAAAAAVNGTP